MRSAAVCLMLMMPGLLLAGIDQEGIMYVLNDLEHVKLPEYLKIEEGSGREAPGTGQILVTKDLETYRQELKSTETAPNKAACREASGEQAAPFSAPFNRPA